MKPLLRIGSFVAVGCAAAVVHLGVVVWLVSGRAMPPLLANIAGWPVAFLVSFLGHWQLTFRAAGVPWQGAMPRFLVLSLAGFAINETAYAVLLHLTGLRYDVLLAAVLVGVAVITYLLSSGWAFRGNSRR